MKKILVLEDDIRLNETLSVLLAAAQFKVFRALSLKEATKLVATTHFDAVISDFLLSDGDGFLVLNFLNTVKPRPKLFFITAYAEKDMAIKLINHKIDGLFEKPFEFSKVMARLKQELADEDTSAEPNLLTLIPARKSIQRDGLSVELTDVEFKLISYLLAKKNLWITRDELIEYIWGGATNSRNTLDTHLSNLKRKVPQFKEDLKVIRGRGFNFSPEA